VDELQQTVKTAEKPLQDPVVTAPNEINNGTFKPAHKHNNNGKKYSKNRNHKNGSSTKIQTAGTENGTETNISNGNGSGNVKKESVNQQTKETTQEQKPQNKKYFRKNPNQRRFFNRDRNQNQSQQLNLSNKMISVVVPLYNEEDSLVELSVALKKVLDNLRCGWEVLFIDDGSTDTSYQKLQEIHKVNGKFKCLKFKRNYGKSSALQEGFKAAKGDYVITMDADLQDDPEEIPALIAKLNEGFDLVSGWKKVRHDPFIKKHTSKLFNGVTSMMVGLKLHDYNCGLKAYVRDVVKNVKVYGEMHRYIPALAHLSGFRVTEMAVTHHERKYGKTKYGLSRFFNGLFDLITVLFTTKYIKRPLHLFGFIGVMSFMAGTGILLYLTILKFFESTPISGRPLFFVGILMAIVGVQFFSIGLIGEMITKTSVENDNVIIDKTLGLGS
jgi:glycosyltransferase involved in cell wall biosynthesis